MAEITRRKITRDYINKFFKDGLKKGTITKEEHDKWLAFVKEKYANMELDEKGNPKQLKATNEIKKHFVELYLPQLNNEDIGTGGFI